MRRVETAVGTARVTVRTAAIARSAASVSVAGMVKCENGDTYLVRHDERSDTKELTTFRAERVGER
jgi:hypothetical protein